MREPSCACVHPDQYECSRIRNGPRNCNIDEDEPYEDPALRHACECSCHIKDEDGFDEWDDKE